MDLKEKLKGRRVLIVDDEKDVLDSLIEILSECKIDAASTFEEASKLLEKNVYDIAVLDIMGVSGFDLLKIANKRNIPALMFTAHALTKENLKKSAEEGAAYYAPKDEMEKIKHFIIDVLEAVEKKKNPWEKCFARLGGFYDKKFGGKDWREKEREFWKKKLDNLPGL
jgi:DNA-binding NtrC family response regulator